MLEKIRKHFDGEAREFDGIIKKLIPYYDEMTTALISAIPFPSNSTFKAIDLGCGTGTVTKKIKERFPNSKITCLDLAENMIDEAKNKLKEYEDIKYVVCELSSYHFNEKTDLAISSLAIHHLPTDEEKKKFYNKIFNKLSKEGVFLIADMVLAQNDRLQQNNMEKWVEFMSNYFSLNEIEKKWLKKHREEDSPSKLVDQLRWLEDAGFKDVDIIWKYYNFTVFGGVK